MGKKGHLTFQKGHVAHLYPQPHKNTLIATENT